MPPLRVVVVLIEPPAPFGNAAARSYYVLLRGLVARGHRVTAFATASKPAEAAEARRLFPAPEYDLRVYPPPPPGGVRSKLATLRRPYSYMFSADLRRDLARELAAGFDVLHLEQIWGGWLGRGYRAKALVNVRHLPSIDLGEEPPVGLRGRVERWLMARGEQRLLRAYPRYLALTGRLADAIRAANPAARVAVVPVSLDPALYPVRPAGPREPVVTVIGSMNWHPSRSAAVRLLTRLWPAVKARVPAARVQVVGWDARSALREYLHLPDVDVAEDVPDARPYFERAGVLLYAPGRGSGMKIKVLEAMLYGVPVVTTSEGVEGLPAEDGVHAGVCDDDAGLVDRAVRALTDPAGAGRMAAAARALVERHCGPPAVLDGVEAAYAGAGR